MVNFNQFQEQYYSILHYNTYNIRHPVKTADVTNLSDKLCTYVYVNSRLLKILKSIQQLSQMLRAENTPNFQKIKFKQQLPTSVGAYKAIFVIFLKRVSGQFLDNKVHKTSIKYK